MVTLSDCSEPGQPFTEPEYRPTSRQVISLGLVREVTCAGLRALTQVSDSLSAAGGRCIVFAAPQDIRSIVRRTGLSSRLRIVDGPERIETGWWDGEGIARDYYMAVNPRGMRLWIFRNRSRSADWYLHGFFG